MSVGLRLARGSPSPGAALDCDGPRLALGGCDRARPPRSVARCERPRGSPSAPRLARVAAPLMTSADVDARLRADWQRRRGRADAARRRRDLASSPLDRRGRHDPPARGRPAVPRRRERGLRQARASDRRAARVAALGRPLDGILGRRVDGPRRARGRTSTRARSADGCTTRWRATSRGTRSSRSSSPRRAATARAARSATPRRTTARGGAAAGRQRGGELDAPIPGGPARHGRRRVAHAPRRADPVRPVPRPQDGEVDAEGLPGFRRGVRADAPRAGRRPRHGRGQGHGASRRSDRPRSPGSALRQEDGRRRRDREGAAGGHRRDGSGRRRRRPRGPRAVGHRAGQPVVRAGVREPDVGALPGSRLRRSRRRHETVEPARSRPICSTRSPPTSSPAVTTSSTSCASSSGTTAYAASAAPLDEATAKADPEAKLWERFRVTPLGPEELLDAVVAATKLDAIVERPAGSTWRRSARA